MKTTYEKIIAYLEAGYFVEVKDGRDGYCVLSPDKDSDGYYRHSSWSNSDGARSNIGRFYGYSDMEERCVNWKITEVFLQPFTPYKVGQKVIYRGGKKSEIKIVHNIPKGMYDLDCVSYPVFHFELEPVFEDEEEKKIEPIEIPHFGEPTINGGVIMESKEAVIIEIAKKLNEMLKVIQETK